MTEQQVALNKSKRRKQAKDKAKKRARKASRRLNARVEANLSVIPAGETEPRSLPKRLGRDLDGELWAVLRAMTPDWFDEILVPGSAPNRLPMNTFYLHRHTPDTVRPVLNAVRREGKSRRWVARRMQDLLRRGYLELPEGEERQAWRSMQLTEKGLNALKQDLEDRERRKAGKEGGGNRGGGSTGDGNEVPEVVLLGAED